MNIDSECFKIKDARITSLMGGRLSLQAFAVSLRANDPFVLIDDTIYALSEDEFYSTRSLRRLHDQYEQTFKSMLAMEDLSMMQPDEIDFINKVRKALPTCPVCKYKRYRQAIYRLATKYKLQPTYQFESIIVDVKYPATTAKVESKVTTLLDKLYDLPQQDRKPCIDCVEKHVAQAYILAQESQMGYPEHRILMCGHLAEAIDEAPNDIPELKHTLQHCMSITMQTGEAFMPIYPILALIQLIRQHINQIPTDDDSRQEAPPVTDTIDLTDDIKKELENLDPGLRLRVYGAAIDIRNVILEYKINKKEEARIRFEGLVANLADLVLAQAPLFANMLRNRRLMFTADPAMAKDAGYAFDDIVQATT